MDGHVNGNGTATTRKKPPLPPRPHSRGARREGNSNGVTVSQRNGKRRLWSSLKPIAESEEHPPQPPEPFRLLPQPLCSLARAWLFIQLARRIGLIPPSIQRLINDTPLGAPQLSTPSAYVFRDLLSTVLHANLSCVLVPILLVLCPALPPTEASTAITSVAVKTATSMYYLSPLNIVAALDVRGWRTAAVNALVLLFAVLATVLSMSVTRRANAWRTETQTQTQAQAQKQSQTRTRTTAAMSVVVQGIHLLPAVAMLVDGALHAARAPATIRPSLNLRWYLDAEVFPSFRSHFATGISLMGALLSAAVGLSCGKDAGSGRRTATLLAIQAMLWELFATSSWPAVTSLWQAMVVGVAESPALAHRAQVMIALYLLVTAMNVGAFQLWIDNVGNANFFYGMNMLRAAGVAAWVYALAKGVRRGDGAAEEREREKEC